MSASWFAGILGLTSRTRPVLERGSTLPHPVGELLD